MNTEHPPFNPKYWNDVALQGTDMVATSSTHLTFRMTCSKWEGTTFKHSRRISEENNDGTWNIRFAPDYTFKLTDGMRTMGVDAEDFFEDRTQPLAEPGATFRVPPLFSPNGWNEVLISNEHLVDSTGSHREFRLTNSRWGGTTLKHPRRMMDDGSGGIWALRFPGNWDFRIQDAWNSEPVSARDFFWDRAKKVEEPVEKYVCSPSFSPKDWNTFHVPAADAEPTEGGEAHRITLTNSRWEGLHFTHPAKLCKRNGNLLSVRFGPDWEFKLRGGEATLAVPPKELWEDRTEPLEVPGESMATEQQAWFSVDFDPTNFRSIKGATDSRIIVFPWSSELPGAAVFHPKKLMRTSKADSSLVTVSFHDEWEFKVLPRDGGEIAMTAPEFMDATEAWASTPVTMSHRPERLEPKHIAPIENIQIPDDLLDPTYFSTAGAPS